MFTKRPPDHTLIYGLSQLTQQACELLKLQPGVRQIDVIPYDGLRNSYVARVIIRFDATSRLAFTNCNHSVTDLWVNTENQLCVGHDMYLGLDGAAFILALQNPGLVEQIASALWKVAQHWKH